MDQAIQSAVGEDVFSEVFVLVAMGAWVAIALGFLAQIYEKIGYRTRLLFGCSIIVHVIGMLSLWLWAYTNSVGLSADGLALAGIALPLLGLLIFAIALLRKT